MPALIDTGASRTVLTPDAIQRVELPLIQYARMSRAGGMDDKVAVHVASIKFTNQKLAPIHVLEVFCCELPTQPVQCLIGRDILSQWLFVYNGKTGDWWVEEENAVIFIEPPDDIFG